jgi:diguanylate cyclase (GGDEF)-like protein/PAS domain S-box-containing protein
VSSGDSDWLQGSVLAAESDALVAVSQTLARHQAAMDAIEEIALAPAQPSLLLEMCVERARALVRADGSAIELLDDDDTLLFAATSGMLRDQLGGCMALAGTLCGLAISTNEAVLAIDAQRDDRGNKQVATDIGLRATISVPLLQDRSPIGVLMVCSREAGAFSDEDALLLRRLARVAGARLDYSNARDAQKRSEAAMSASRQKYRSVLASIDQGILVVSEKDRIVLTNPAAERMVGQPAYELVGSSPTEWLTQEDGTAWPPELWPVTRALSSRQTVADVVMRVTHPNRRVRWLNATTSPLPSREDGPGGAVITITDVTDRTLAQEQQYEIERLLAETQRLAHVGSWNFELYDGKLTGTWTDEMYRLLGLVPQRMPATIDLYMSCTHPEDRIELMKVTDLLRGGTGAQIQQQHRVVLPSGEVRYLQITGELEVSEDGRHRRAFGSAQDITERLKVQDDLRRVALTDPLTGLGNRLFLVGRLTEAMEWIRRSQGHVAVLAIDLDGLKAVNDTYGHATGDELLRETGLRLGAVVRPNDTVARLGGDEFLLVCQGLMLPAAAELADRVVADLSAPYQLSGGIITWAGASVGVAVTDDPDTNVDQLLAQADRALYEAKDHGGNQYVVHSQTYHREAG